MSAALQEKSPADDTQILSSNSPPAEEASLQKTHFSPLHPTQTPAGPGTLATSETRSLSTSLKSVRRGTKCTLMFSTYCMYCIATALHCIALHCFEL